MTLSLYDSNPDIVDNRSYYFIDEIRKFLKHAKIAKFATGYFFLNGFNLLKTDMENLEKIYILMGSETNRITADEINKGYEERNKLLAYIQSNLSKDLEKLDDTSDQFTNLLALKDFIREEKAEIRVCIPDDGNKFHSKLYVIHRDENAETKDIAIIGSSNFTKPGIMGNTELNYVSKQYETVMAFDRWFTKLYEESKEFSEDFISIIENSNAYKVYQKKQKERDKDYIEPFDLYKLIIYEFLNGDISTYESSLTEFQKLGVENAKEKIRKYGGVIVSDSVGLGKSFIGGELIKWYYEQGKNTLLIVPANIIDQWKELLETDGSGSGGLFFGLNVDGVKINIISDSKFSTHSEDEIKTFYGHFDVVIIDEAHRFRNDESQKYKNIQQLKGKTFILVTATPLNNSVKDLKNLLSIFTNHIVLKNNHLDFNAFNKYEKISRQIRGGVPDNQEFEEQKKYADEISSILEDVMILRTRKVIRDRYPDLKIDGKKIVFSTPTIYPVEYHFSLSYQPIYENIDIFIANLMLPHLYIINESNGQTLEGLIKVLILKRLESSIYAFIQSLDSLVIAENNLRVDIYSKGFASTVLERRGNLDEVKRQIQNDVDLSEFIDDLVVPRTFRDLNERDILDAIEYDIESINKFKEEFISKIKNGVDEYAYDDNKIDRFKSIILKNKDKKVLVFTQFRDTARYIYENLKNIQDQNVELVMGGQTYPSGRKLTFIKDGVPKEKILSERDYKVRLFCPKSNNFVLNGNEKEIDVLISTDTLSEVVNLQDCSVIINYDLPWNPTRIIQRVGRVDRIGNENPITVFNFFPDKDIEALLKLLEKLQIKIKDIATIVGKEYGILRDDEEISIKTIGEKITKLRSIEDIADLEEEATNPIFTITGEDKGATTRFKLRSLINSLGLIKNDFREYITTPYSIAKSEKTGVFSVYRIYDQKTKHKFKEVFLYYNLKTKEISEVDPTEIEITSSMEGFHKSIIPEKNWKLHYLFWILTSKTFTTNLKMIIGKWQSFQTCLDQKFNNMY